MNLSDINQFYFGHRNFKPGQEKLIRAILRGQDCLGIMPTGGGKSLCYQMPALLLPGMTLVISPLISLMKDQVSALQEAGVPAACLNSSLDPRVYRQTLRGLWNGAYKLLYVAPERLESEDFLQAIQNWKISLVAVDEAHCISQWGQDFRPSYLRIAGFLKHSLPERPIVAAFTATATVQVRQDIIRLLTLQEPELLIADFDRPNLYFEVLSPQDKTSELLRLLEGRKKQSGIVYCSTRPKVDHVWEMLCRSGFQATRYHAGLCDEERRQNQEDFQFDRVMIMVATNAFGMGIDKSNVNFVIHYNMPKNLEGYYQEAGRAGRDGGRAECILLYSSDDVRTARFLIEHGGNHNDALSEKERETVRQQDFARLNAMEGYCRSRRCLRQYLLNYFGQAHPEICTNCGNCRGETTLEDVTIQAKMLLSCVRRIEDKLGHTVGATLVIQILRGGRGKQLMNLGLDKLTTYGLMRGQSKEQVQAVLNELIEQQMIRKNPCHGALVLTEKAGAVLFRGARVMMPVKVKPTARRLVIPNMELVAPLGEEKSLFEFLKTVRLKIAREENVPAYIVFTDSTLRDMARKRPKNKWELLQVLGVGEVKARRYGERFLNAIQSYGQMS